MKKVLLLTDVNFEELSSGNRARIYALVNYLSTHVQLTVVNTGPADQNVESRLSALFASEFFTLEKTKYLSSTGYGRRLKTFLKDRRFDAIIVEYIHCSYFLNFFKYEVTLILDAHDIVSERTKAFKKFNHAGALYELPLSVEKDIFSLYDRVIVLCPDDVVKVTSMAGSGKALLCPHPVNIVTHPIRKEVNNIAFVGSAYLPNVDAVNWFLKNCWPTITAKYNAQFHIYGTVCSNVDFAGQLNVIPKGFNGDINEIYHDADIIINPVRFGAGIKIKNIEALAHGRPLVTTLHGARGIENSTGEAFLIADNAADFTQAIETLLIDATLRKKLSENAHRLISRSFSEDNCFTPLIKLIENI
ncbi:glycosyltransferase family 4 protein [Mucilaginibacter gilvus]|uniref:Glycosyltransferase n=1 Tax=Mucilaginibacter gilvus TaxID=2305909 RepID=A0A444MJ98_9SPHI|nr:glycosyltransferase family 4 protein [Mucilaginibacter gilvus]RWY48328.1 glycosyltransferase [Mucilaginibacter gilvus]